MLSAKAWIALAAVGFAIVCGIAVWSQRQTEDRLDSERSDKLAALRKRVASGPFAFNGDVDDLVTEFRVNELAAKDRYLGQAMRVSGRIRRVTRDASGQIVIFMEGNQTVREVVCDYDGVESIAHSLDAGERRIAHGISAGQDVAGPVLVGCAIEPP